MGWSLRTRSGGCGSCGAQLVRGASWCGACGARIAPSSTATARDEVVARSAHVTDGPPDGVVGRRAAVGLLTALLVVALAAVVLRTEPPVAVLGRTDVGTGMTSSGLPPDELRLAWSHELPDEGWWGDPGTLVVGDGLAHVASRVVDLASGAVVRTVDVEDRGTSRLVVRLSGRDLVVVDQLSGTVVSRAELPQAVFDVPVWPAARHGDVTMLSRDDGTWLVRDDGTVLAELPGWHETWISGRPSGADEPAAVALRTDFDMATGPTGAVRLVSLRDGSTVLEREATARDALQVQVDGDRAVLAWQRGAVDTPVDGLPVWDVELVDAVSGEVLVRREFAALEPPRIVARTPAGGTVLGVGVEQDVELWEVAPGAGDPLLRTTVLRQFSSPWDAGWGHEWGGTVAVTERALVVRFSSPQEVEARTLDGDLVWQQDSGGAVGLQVDGDVVALLPEPGPTGLGSPGSVIRLLDATDGSHLAAVDPSPALEARQWGARPSVVLDGTVAIAQTSSWPAAGATELSGARWLDLRTGDVVPTVEVLAPWTDEGSAVVGAVWLYGLVTDPSTGALTPAVIGNPGDGTVRVLQDGGFTELELPSASAAFRDGYVMPVGMTADRVALWAEFWDHEGGAWSTHLVHRGTGDVRELPDVVGRLLTDDVLVAVAQEPGSWAAAAPLVGIDPDSGEVRWTGPSVSTRDGAPLHDGDLLVVGDTLRRTAVALADGRTLWSYVPDEELLDGGVLTPGLVLLATTTGEVLALDRTTGSELWRRDVGAPVTSLTGAGDGALVATLGRELVVLDGTGEVVRRHTLGDVALHAAALGETVVVVHQRDNRVVGLRPDGAGFTTDDEVDLP